MASKRNKKYTMRAISPKFSEKGGFTAQFTGDGYSIDAFDEILPDVIERNGIKVSEGVAKDLISKFLQASRSYRRPRRRLTTRARTPTSRCRRTR